MHKGYLTGCNHAKKEAAKTRLTRLCSSLHAQSPAVKLMYVLGSMSISGNGAGAHWMADVSVIGGQVAKLCLDGKGQAAQRPGSHAVHGRHDLLLGCLGQRNHSPVRQQHLQKTWLKSAKACTRQCPYELTKVTRFSRPQACNRSANYYTHAQAWCASFGETCNCLIVAVSPRNIRSRCRV